MFEHSNEQQDDVYEDLIFDHHRLSNYVSMFYQMNENAAISHVTYYQPSGLTHKFRYSQDLYLSASASFQNTHYATA
jgi:hypothetical protein